MYFRKVKKINSILFNIEEVFDGNQDIDMGIAGLEKDVLQHITGKTDEMNIMQSAGEHRRQISDSAAASSCLRI